MRKIVAGLFISLDGVVEAPERWGFEYARDDLWQEIAAGVAEADAVLLGRRTYEQFAKLWPRQGSDTPMAAFLNGSPKYVASTRLERLEWDNSRLIRGDLRAALTALKGEPGKNIQVPGSPRLVASLVEEGLLDELRLSICPVVVGSGMRLFDEVRSRLRLELVQSRTFAGGVLGVTYRREPAPGA